MRCAPASSTPTGATVSRRTESRGAAHSPSRAQPGVTRCRGPWWLITFVALVWGAGARAEQAPPSRGDLLVFASAEGYRLADSEVFDDDVDGVLTTDLLGSWTTGRFRVMGELFVTTEEQDLERLQAGWEIRPDTLLWLGRFHQPGSFWNTRYHHGQFLQTSISRPSIESWEDDSGVLPQHVMGALFESRVPLGESGGVSLALSAGLGPLLRDHELHPVEIFNPDSRPRGGSFAVQASFLPDYSSNDGVGMLASHTEVMLDDAVRPYGADCVDLDVIGLFFDFAPGRWRITSTTYWVHSDFDGTAGGGSDSFVSGYLQAQRTFGDRFTALARFEASANADDSAYVALFEDFVEQRKVVDLRWDFARRHALTVEWADTDTLRDRYHEYRLQWSAALR